VGLLLHWKHWDAGLAIHQTRSPSAGCSGQRASKHAQLGAPRHGTGVFWGTTSCRKAAPLTHTAGGTTQVPLGEKWGSVLAPEQRFTPAMAVAQVAAQGKRVGLVIDLTRTHRYYDPAEVERLGVPHIKIPCHGRDGPPEPEVRDSLAQRERERERGDCMHAERTV
jgi:hypothetical protein